MSLLVLLILLPLDMLTFDLSLSMSYTFVLLMVQGKYSRAKYDQKLFLVMSHALSEFSVRIRMVNQTANLCDKRISLYIFVICGTRFNAVHREIK